MSEQAERQINDNLNAIADAIAKQISSGDAKPPVMPALNLLKGLLVDINRIADALEHIARNMPEKKPNATLNSGEWR